MNRKEREREFKRQEILMAALKLFAEKGFDQTTLDEIAVASEFGKGTIYNYFQNKDELFEAILMKSSEDYNKIIAEVSSETESFKDFVTILTKRILGYSVDNYESFLILAKQRTRAFYNAKSKLCDMKNDQYDQFITVFRERIEIAINKGEMKNANPYSLIILYRSMIYPYIYFSLQYHGKENVNIEEEAEFILSVFFNGILKK